MQFQAPESLSEQIAQYLGQQIIRGDLKPRARIQELKLARELDVSRGSVREALLILQGRHLVEIYPRRGAVVSELSAREVDSLYDIYNELLVMLGTRFAERWREGDLEPLLAQVQNVSQKMRNTATPIEDVIEAGFELMRLSYPVVDNPYLEETLESFRPSVSRTHHLVLRHRRNESYRSVKFYNSLIGAVQARDQQALQYLIRSYGQQQRQLVLTVLRELEETAP